MRASGSGRTRPYPGASECLGCSPARRLRISFPRAGHPDPTTGALTSDTRSRIPDVAGALDLPIDDPVLYWRAGDERRCVVGLPLAVTKIVLTRLLESYRQPYVAQSLLTGALADPG